VEAVARFAGQTRQARVNAGNEDGDGGVLDRSRVEERRHEGELVVLAAEVEALAGLPAVPNGAYGLDLFAQLAGGAVGPGQAKAALDVGLDLGAQAEDEAPARLRRQVPGRVRQGQRAAGKGDGHGGAKLEPLGVLGDERQRQEGVVLGLGGPHRGKAGGLGRARQRRNVT
jgi:hypothetical protein